MKKITTTQIIVGSIFLLTIIGGIIYYLRTKNNKSATDLKAAIKPPTPITPTLPPINSNQAPPVTNVPLLTGMAVSKTGTTVFNEDFTVYNTYGAGETVGTYVGPYSNPDFAIIRALDDGSIKYVTVSSINIV